MMQPDPTTLARVIRNAIGALYDDGTLSDLKCDGVLGYTCQGVFGFSPSDVAGLHTHKQGHGDGLWFRLHDGRVISADREASDPDLRLYDSIDN